MFDLKEILYMKSDEQLAPIAQSYALDTAGLTKLQVIEAIVEAIITQMHELNSSNSTNPHNK